MVDIKNNGEQIPFEFREDDSCIWKDVADGFGNFVEPSWMEGYQYRRKPEPDVVKPKWPTLDLDHSQLWAATGVTLGESWSSTQTRNAINYGIAHALETGLVVLPESVNKPAQINYKGDANAWGGALNAASWEFIENSPEKSALLFNSCKTSLRAAILKYLELVEEQSSK